MSRAHPDTTTAILEYRCTRADLYPPNSLGHLDTKGRQGHYITAATMDEAASTMLAKYPEDNVIDVQAWDPYGSNVHRYVRTADGHTTNRMDLKPA